jgi:hypothetical protein
MRFIDPYADMNAGLGHALQQPLQPIPPGDITPMSDPDRPTLTPPKPHDKDEPSAEPVEPDQM